ncbi:MAG: MFS transporter [candidate division Zixibacteria bacterium]|nr:MFS transporter [candidate division Zixibacteria bacterium]
MLVRFTTGILLVPLLIGLGFFALSIGPIYLTIVQDYLNSNKALGNGIFMSMNFLLRSLVILLVGLIGDAFGIQNIYLAGGVLALFSLPIVFALPEGKNNAR